MWWSQATRTPPTAPMAGSEAFAAARRRPERLWAVRRTGDADGLVHDRGGGGGRDGGADRRQDQQRGEDGSADTTHGGDAPRVPARGWRAGWWSGAARACARAG